jgi:hypothetical protein
MSSRQQEARTFQPRNLSQAESIVALLGMADTLALVLECVRPGEDLVRLKQRLIRDMKNSHMCGPGVRDEAAVVDMVVDLIELAFDSASLPH